MYDTSAYGNIVACILVCRKWQATFTPLLWEVYDNNVITCEASICKDENGQYITADRERNLVSDVTRIVPLKTFCNFSNLIRYAELTHPLPKGALLSTRLQGLEISSAILEINLNILERNPGLLSLKLNMTANSKYSNIQGAMESLSSLTTLEIDHCVFSDKHQLVMILNNNPGLRFLHIGTSGGAIQSYDNCDVLPNLSNISIGCRVVQRPAHVKASSYSLATLFSRCPNLKTLGLDSRNYDLSIIAQDLKEHCPKIQTLSWSDSTGGSDEEHMALIQSVRRLKNVSFYSIRHSPNVLKTLLQAHASSLRSIHLAVNGNIQEFAAGANRILSTCIHLRHITLHGPATVPNEREHLRLDWLKGPWNCPHLKSLVLHGFVDPQGYTGEEVHSILGQVEKDSRPRFRHLSQSMLEKTIATCGWI
ncbi:hypothetical protein BG004_000770 [Podila humilis]|nr:hypothetical protein BG004_000770 [Podila humilis]